MTDDPEKLKERKPQCSVPLQPMTKWIQEETPDTECRPCIIPVTIDWYNQELTEQNRPELAKKLEEAQKTGDPEVVCQAMDEIKAAVPLSLQHRLQEFDCATQEFAAEEESGEAPSESDEASPESSPPESRSPGTGSETPQAT